MGSSWVWIENDEKVLHECAYKVMYMEGGYVYHLCFSGGRSSVMPVCSRFYSCMNIIQAANSAQTKLTLIPVTFAILTLIDLAFYTR